MRLEKYLVECGVESRKKIKKAILAGEVIVNGIVEIDERVQVSEDDEITYRGEKTMKKIFSYYIMYKIGGYITAMEDDNKPTVADLLPSYIDKKSIFPVGRLDLDTEGLLIFTNDGDLNYKLTHPTKKIEKTYYVELDREISMDDIKRLEEGVMLDTGYKSLPSKAEYLSPQSIHLTIIEGKYHQVKKMMKAIGNKVTYLKRVRFGNLTLEDMKKGEVREIKREKILDNI